MFAAVRYWRKIHKARRSVLRSGSINGDQGKAAFTLDSLSKVRGRFCQDDFQGWSYVGLQQVTRDSGSVPLAEYSVNVNRRFAVWIHGNIADKRSNLDLLLDRDRMILLSFPIKVSELGALKRANTGNCGRGQALIRRELLEA